MSDFAKLFLLRRAKTYDGDGYPMPITLRKMAVRIIAGDYHA
jgi:hypothetical protein